MTKSKQNKNTQDVSNPSTDKASTQPETDAQTKSDESIAVDVTQQKNASECNEQVNNEQVNKDTEQKEPNQESIAKEAKSATPNVEETLSPSQKDELDALEQEADEMLRYSQDHSRYQAETNKTTIIKQQTKAKLSKLAMVATVIALASVAANVWQFQQAQQGKLQVEQLSSKFDSRAAQISSLNEQLQNLQSQLQQQTQNTQSEWQQVKSQQTALQQKIEVIAGKSQNEWALAEADYLLQLAIKRLQFEQDIKTATALLLSADKTLARAADNDLLALREAIANDIGSLKSLAQSDTTKVMLDLETLMAMVPNLVLPHQTAEEVLSAYNEQKETEEDKDWKQKLIDVIKPAIRFRKHDRPLEPLLSESENNNLRHNVILALQHAQIAVLRKQQALYDQQLAKVNNWVTQYFSTSQENSLEFKELLAHLQQTLIAAALPKLNSPTIARAQLTTTLQDLLNNKSLQMQNDLDKQSDMQEQEQ